MIGPTCCVCSGGTDGVHTYCATCDEERDTFRRLLVRIVHESDNSDDAELGCVISEASAALVDGSGCSITCVRSPGHDGPCFTATGRNNVVETLKSAAQNLRIGDYPSMLASEAHRNADRLDNLAKAFQEGA